MIMLHYKRGRGIQKSRTTWLRNVWTLPYIFELKKRRIFFGWAANQSAEARVKGRKCRCHEIISAQIKQTQTRIMIMILMWRKLNMIHQVNYLLTTKFKLHDVLQLFSLLEQTSRSSVINYLPNRWKLQAVLFNFSTLIFIFL